MTSRTRRAPTRPETILFALVAVPVIVWVGLRLPEPSTTVQIVSVGLLAAILGLPHGALDPIIARHAGVWARPSGLVVFGLGYLAMVVVVVIVWLLLPVAGLVGFLLISAAHFGSDWNATGSIRGRFVVGVGLLTLPALGHPAEVGALYETLAPGGALVAQVQASVGLPALTGMIVAALVASRREPIDGLEIVVVGALALIAPPLIFFVIYFCALHSVRHLREGLRSEQGRLRPAILSIVAFTAIPIGIGLVVIASVGTGAPMDQTVLRLVFVGLAGLTVPHMLLTALADRRTRLSR